MKKNLRRLMIILFCVLLLAALTCTAFADAGGYGGDADFGGGGDDGGGYDGGWDNDYGGNSDSYSRSTGSSDGDGWIAIPVILIWGIIIAAIVSSAMKRSNKRSVNISRSAAPLPSLRPMQEYGNLDPGFRPEALIERISNFYIQFQQCWQKKDLSSLRPYFADAFYAQLNNQLQRYITDRKTNYVDRPTVLGVDLDGFTQDGGFDHIYATIRTRIVDYTLSDVDGRLLSGSKTAEKFMTYRYHLVRPTGVGSDVVKGTRAISCPHCGAPLNINQSAKCPYCDSVVTVEKHDFVISRIEGISQVTA